MKMCGIPKKLSSIPLFFGTNWNAIALENNFLH
jgi:hypothetical protein